MNHNQAPIAGEAAQESSGGDDWSVVAEAPTGLDAEQTEDSGSYEDAATESEFATAEDGPETSEEATDEEEAEEIEGVEEAEDEQGQMSEATGRHDRQNHQSEQGLSVADIQRRMKDQGEYDGDILGESGENDDTETETPEAEDTEAEDATADEAEADAEQESSPAEDYEDKVHTLEQAQQEETKAELAAERKSLLLRTGKTEKVVDGSMWTDLTTYQARQSYKEVGQMLEDNKDSVDKPAEDRDQLDTVTSALAFDLKGTSDTDQLRKAPDAADLSVDGGLEDLIDSGELDDPKVLDRATQALRMLTTAGIYKMNRWGNPAQLTTALGLVEQYAEKVPGFDPQSAGYDEAKRSLTRIQAASQIEEGVKARSRPTREMAEFKPHSELGAHAADGLMRLRRTEAHRFLRQHDGDVSLTQQERAAARARRERAEDQRPYAEKVRALAEEDQREEEAMRQLRQQRRQEEAAQRMARAK